MSADRLLAAIRSYIDPALDELHKRIDTIPQPRDGRDGLDGTGLAGAFIDREGELTVSLSDGRFATLGPVHGRDGRDGVGFDDLDVVHDGERTVTLRFICGEDVKAFTLKFSVPLYRGVYRDGEAYERGDMATFGGSIWHCNAETSEKPGEGSTAWTLAAKRGRDGRSVK